ncbi:dockerin type I repeat-containing protein [Marinicella sp. W31]|uniref:dockerin type I repeat-containing protein n=1 Tax=Marinicella sp. W31 TaxID=3023713 RepID=UPI003757AD55
MRFKTLLLLSFSLCFSITGNTETLEENSVAGAINPNGIFFNRFTGGFDGTEWFQTTPIAGTNRFQLVDIFGGGFNATITPQGNITLDGGAGTGSFSDADNYVIMPSIGNETFTFTSNRVPFTSASFPLQLDSIRPANNLFSGNWSSTIETINPETGVLENTSNTTLNLTASGSTLRITDQNNIFYQGIFETGRQIIFRRLVPDPFDPSVESFPGSDTNSGENLIANVYFETINHFNATLLLQTRAPLGSQIQTVLRISANRQTPLQQGDINGDGLVNATDRNLLVDQLNATVEDAAYNLAADLNRDDVIDNVDLSIFDGGDVIFTNGFE